MLLPGSVGLAFGLRADTRVDSPFVAATFQIGLGGGNLLLYPHVANAIHGFFATLAAGLN
jgi:hypothetical protein